MEEWYLLSERNGVKTVPGKVATTWTIDGKNRLPNKHYNVNQKDEET